MPSSVPVYAWAVVTTNRAAFGVALAGRFVTVFDAPEIVLFVKVCVPVVVTTHPTQQKNMNAALDELSKLDVIGSRPICIRIVEIPEDKD